MGTSTTELYGGTSTVARQKMWVLWQNSGKEFYSFFRKNGL
jgi:hypothetical protein